MVFLRRLQFSYLPVRADGTQGMWAHRYGVGSHMWAHSVDPLAPLDAVLFAAVSLGL